MAISKALQGLQCTLNIAVGLLTVRSAVSSCRKLSTSARLLTSANVIMWTDITCAAVMVFRSWKSQNLAAHHFQQGVH